MLIKEIIVDRNLKLDFFDSYEKVIKMFMTEKETVIPVYQENTLTGVVRLIDVFNAMTNNCTPDVSQLVRDEPHKYIVKTASIYDIEVLEDYLIVLDEEGNKEGIILPLDIAKISPSLDKTAKELAREIDAIINFSSDELFVTDGQGVTLRANAVFEENSGIEVAKIIGKDVYALEHQNGFYPSATRLVIEKKEQQSVLKTQKGSKTLVTATPVFNDDGTIFRIIANSRNIAKLNKLQEQLEKSEQEKQRYYEELLTLRESVLHNEEVIASSTAMKNTMNLIEKIAVVDSTVLLLGESGVGKGLIANYIYKVSKRKGASFISINCGAIPENLLESELFGYRGGAFTGARKEGKLGKIELANGGTFFLDEIAELPLNLQVKLLHVIQERQMTPVGGTKQINLDVRFIAATNRNLEELVKKGKFRRDLFFRLNVLPIKIPSLRERKEDIEDLANLFLAKFNKKYNATKKIDPEVFQYFNVYSWPGNIRELENLLERLVIVVDGNTITIDDLGMSINKAYSSMYGKNPLYTGNSLSEAMKLYEQAILTHASNSSKSTYEIAEKLGIDQSTVVRKLQKFNITRKSPK